MVIETLLLFRRFTHCGNISILSISIDYAWELLLEEAEVPAKALAPTVIAESLGRRRNVNQSGIQVEF